MLEEARRKPPERGPAENSRRSTEPVPETGPRRRLGADLEVRGKSGRPSIRDLIGDFSEQTGAHFG